MATTQNTPTLQSSNINEEFDKFQGFERWLITNGAQFPGLMLHKYDNSDRFKTDHDTDATANTTGMDDNISEEKKDGGVCSTECEQTKSNEINDGSDEMRGVHALTNLPPQAIIVSIPLRCLITVEMGQNTPIGRKILSSDLELDAPKHIFLMIYLLWDRAVHGNNSFFAPYYAVLPKRLRNMPIFWSQDELQMLKGSHLLSQISDRVHAITRDYHSVCSVAPEFASIATLEEFTWARAIVCSRNFGLMINGRRTSALVPHADMLNHHRPRETKWTFCEDSQCFTITTLREIGAGEQVYDSYGQKCNHRFLLNYGFCVEKNIEIDGFCPNEVSLELGGWDELEEEEIYGHSSDKGRGKLSQLIYFGDRECMEKKVAFWTRGDVDAVGDECVGSSWHAIASHIGRMGCSTSLIMEGTLATDTITSSLAEASSTTPPQYPILFPAKRLRVCVSNNENTRIMFSMLRVLVCNSAELHRISYGGKMATAAGQRIWGVQGTSSSSSQSVTSNMCRDIRYPISLRNERCAMELLLEITERALSKYPTSLIQDTLDLQDEKAYPRYSNRRHAKLQVHGEKEVLHHFALWARTAIHVIDIISNELANEIKLATNISDGTNHDKVSDTESKNKEFGFECVIEEMEEDDNFHITILRYCSDVLGAVRSDELNQIALEVMSMDHRKDGVTS